MPSAGLAGDPFDALGDRHRRAIVELLGAGGRCGASQPPGSSRSPRMRVTMGTEPRRMIVAVNCPAAHALTVWTARDLRVARRPHRQRHHLDVVLEPRIGGRTSNAPRTASRTTGAR